MIHPKFLAINEKGKLKIYDRPKFDEYLQTLPDKVFIVVKSAKEREIRSNEQNRYYWGVVVELISEHTGYTKDEVHEILKALFLSRPIEIGGKEVLISKSTASLNTKEMEEYLEGIRVWAVDKVGLSIPEPERVEDET